MHILFKIKGPIIKCRWFTVFCGKLHFENLYKEKKYKTINISPKNSSLLRDALSDSV